MVQGSDPESRSVGNESERSLFDRTFPHLFGIMLAAPLVIGTVSAQPSVGCPVSTQMADGITQSFYDIISLVVIACIAGAGVGEGISRFVKDPNKSADWKSYRNGAAIGVVSVPALLWFIVAIAGNFGISYAGCVDLNPFF